MFKYQTYDLDDTIGSPIEFAALPNTGYTASVLRTFTQIFSYSKGGGVHGKRVEERNKNAGLFTIHNTRQYEMEM